MIKEQAWLQLQCVVFLVCEHHSSLISNSFVDNDTNHTLFGGCVFKHLFTKDARKFNFVEKTDCMDVSLFADV